MPVIKAALLLQQQANQFAAKPAPMHCLNAYSMHSTLCLQINAKQTRLQQPVNAMATSGNSSETYTTTVIYSLVVVGDQQV